MGGDQSQSLPTGRELLAYRMSRNGIPVGDKYLHGVSGDAIDTASEARRSILLSTKPSHAFLDLLHCSQEWFCRLVLVSAIEWSEQSGDAPASG